MKIFRLLLLCCTGLTACSAPEKNNTLLSHPPTSAIQPSSRIVTEFKREGISIYYTANGEVEKIEAIGYGKLWQNQYEHEAELDAKEKLTKFLRGESVTSSRKTNIIAKSLERVNDKSKSNTSNSTDGIRVLAEDIDEKDPQQNNTELASMSKSYSNRQAFNNAQTITTSITVTAAGRLSAVKKIRGQIIEDGKIYMAIYEWSPKQQSAVKFITNSMDTK